MGFGQTGIETPAVIAFNVSELSVLELAVMSRKAEGRFSFKVPL
jgi:hypothetical protein